MGKTKYIRSMGELTRKDHSICFRKNGKNVYIPIENTKEIYCLNEVSINTKLLDFLSQNHVVVHFFHYYKGYTGTFYPKNQYNSGKVLIKQVETFKDPVRRLKIAKSIVLGIGKNIYEALYHYYRHGKSDLKPFLDWIHQDFSEAVKTANSIPEIMAYEGNLWEGFYRSLVYFLPENFILNKRVKRPPDNPMNALISFGNMLLYTKMISAIYRTHLDQRISFLHDPSERRFSLSLDLSEAFKPVIVYRTIFELVNRKRLKVEKHFDKKVNYCLLNEEGRDIFIEAFEARLQSVFTHKKLKRKISYQTAMKLDAYKLIKMIMEGQDFKPFDLKENL